MAATFTFSASDLRLGPCRVKFNSVDLGGTMGGVKMTLTPSFVDLKIDQYGDTPVDSVLTGQSYQVEMTLAGSAKKDNWMIAMPYAVQTVNGAESKIEVSGAIGTQMSQFAEELELHPLDIDDADLSETFTFPKAYVTSAVEVEFGANNQRGLKITFKIIADATGKYFTYGDPTLVGA